MPRLGFGVSDDFSTRRTTGRRCVELNAHPGMMRERIDRDASRICLSIAAEENPDTTAERACAYAGYYTMVFAALCTFAPASTASAMDQVARLLPIAITVQAPADADRQRTDAPILRGTQELEAGSAFGNWTSRNEGAE